MSGFRTRCNRDDHWSIVPPGNVAVFSPRMLSEAIKKAAVVYILGYGFDKNNNDRLKLNDSLKFSKLTFPKGILFTNYGDSDRVNKTASRLFFDHPSQFWHGRPRPMVWQEAGKYCEKSVRDVYEALELDFDSLENFFA